jgi:Tol biopolymer transport system component
VHLAALGSETDELGASVSADGTIWFASDRPGGSGGWDLYSATIAADTYGEPVAVEALNTPVWEFNPAIDADGTTIVFTSINRPGGIGLGDLFAATRDGETWSEAEPLAVNSSADEYHPSRSADGETLYYVRRAGQGDFYAVPWAEVAPGG